MNILDSDNADTDAGIYARWPQEKYRKFIRQSPQVGAMLMTGRGCKYKCSYCYRGVKYSSVRQIPLDIVERDLQYLQKMHYEAVYMYDDCFLTTNFNRLEETLTMMGKYDFHYGISIRYEMCFPKVFEMLGKINLFRVQIGLQSASFDINKEM